MQEWINLEGVSIPVIKEWDGIYYPISFITIKILKRNNKNSLNGNKDKIKKFKIEFSTTNIQECNCILEEELKKLLSNSQVGRLSIEQRTAQNILHRYLGIPLLTERTEYIDQIQDEFLNEHDIFTRNIILNHNYEEARLCSSCNKYYPLTNKFFRIDSRVEKGLLKICKICDGSCTKFTNDILEEKSIYKQCGEEGYDEYLNNDVIAIFKRFINGEIKNFPIQMKTKENYLLIINYLYNEKILDKDNINTKNITNKTRFSNFNQIVSIHEIYSNLFGDNYYFHPWKYNNFKWFTGLVLNYEIANKVFSNYLEEYNIQIKDIFKFDYTKIAKKAKINGIVDDDLLYFLVQYHKFKYPGYKFKVNSINYYKSKENRIFDLKHLIEKDMKICIDKIPLYLTLTTIKKIGTNTMYHTLKKYYKNLFEWVNECYPNKFIESDFVVNIIRNEFDSVEEAQIHELLKERFKNVIYNNRNSENTIEIAGHYPDWVVFTDNKCWLIEYFGLYVPKLKGTSGRVGDYINRADKKIEEYNKLEGYGKIYLYSDDIKNDMEGIKKKLDEIY